MYDFQFFVIFILFVFIYKSVHVPSLKVELPCKQKILPFFNIIKSSASTITNRSLPWGGLLRTTIMPDLC